MTAEKPPGLSISALLRKLTEGWEPHHHGLTQIFLQSWKEKVSPMVEVKEVGHNSLYFLTDLPEVHLLGADDVHALMLAGMDDASEVLKFWKRKASAARRLLLVLALSEPVQANAKEVFASDRALVMSAAELRRLLESAEPSREITRLLQQRLPLRSLIPYNYLRPAHGQIFFGRHEELGRLLQEDDVSFAIAGPGRIGKTSLIRQFQRLLVKKRDPRALRLVEIDFYACSDTSSQEVARFFAMKIESSSRSHRMTSEGLIDFLRYQNHERGGPLELILDEVDEVCQSAAFDAIGEAAKLGLCRLIMCGRGQLFRMLLSQSSPLNCRLELMRPGPLESDEAKALLLLPLQDLGLRLENPEALTEKVFKLTGRLPHLLQFYGKKITEMAAENAVTVVSEEMIETLSWDLDTAQYVTSPLRELTAPRTRLLALTLLKENPPELSVMGAQSLAERHGLQLTYDQTFDILNDLIISSVLSWRKGVVSISSQALPIYAARLGYLDRALTEARAQLAAAPSPPQR